MTEHTPGPWHVSQWANFVRKADGDWPAWNICELNDAVGNMAANAHLIAAAPDLLAALESIATWTEAREMSPQQIAQSAIAKARGH